MDPGTKIIFTAGAYFALYTTLATFFTPELIRLLVEHLLHRRAEPRERLTRWPVG